MITKESMEEYAARRRREVGIVDIVPESEYTLENWRHQAKGWEQIAYARTFEVQDAREENARLISEIQRLSKENIKMFSFGWWGWFFGPITNWYSDFMDFCTRRKKERSWRRGPHV